MDFHVRGLILKFIKPEHSPINLLGKFLFQRSALWEQRHKTIILLLAVALGLSVGAIAVGLILLDNSRH